MKFEGIVLSEISQIEKGKYRMLSHVESFKANSQKQREEWWFPGTGWWGKWGDVCQRLQTPSDKMKKFWEFNTQHSDYSYYVIYLNLAKVVDLQRSHHRKEMAIL